MEYTVFVTEEPDAVWRAVVPTLPECIAEAETMDGALAKIRQRIMEAMRRTKVVRIEIPLPEILNGNESGHSSYTTFAQEWPDFGKFRDDPTLDELFDEIERRRDAHLVGG